MDRALILALATLPGWTGALLVQEARTVSELALVWEYATPKEFPQGIVCDKLGRPLLHVAMKNGGLLILDTGTKDGQPRPLAKLGLEHFRDLQVMHLTQAGEYLYLALGEFFGERGAPAGLAIVNVKNPRQPKVLAVWRSDAVLKGSAIVVVGGGHAYLGAMKEGVMIFDVSRPEKIVHVSTFQPDIHFPRKNPGKVQHPNARGMELRGNLLYLCYDAGGVRVLDVSDKKKPREIGRYINAQMAHKQQAHNNIVLHKNLAYIAVDYAGLEIVDIGNPRDIRPVGWWNPWNAHAATNIWFNSPGHTNQIELDASKKLVYMSAGDSDLQVVDVSDPAHPRLAARYGSVKDKLGVWGLTMCGDRVYLAYVTAFIPFQSIWAGIKAVKRY